MEMNNRQVRGRGRSKRQFANHSLHRKFEEISLHNKVLRVHLRRENLDSLRIERSAHRGNFGFGKTFSGKRHSNSAFGSSAPRSRTSSSNLSLRKALLRQRNSSSEHTSPVQSPKTPSSLAPGLPQTNKVLKQNSASSQQIVFKTNLPDSTKVFGRSGVKSITKETDKQKTLNKVISKDKFRIKLFPQKVPQTSPMKRVLNNGEKLQNGPLKLDDESMYRPVKPGQKFFLKFAPPKPIEEGKLGYDFHSLVADVKTLQLPGPTWKIKVIIKHNRIAALIFTNKLELERSVSFNSDSDKYDIIIDNMPVLLLGSPEKVCHSTDIEVLLNIIQNIESTNPMILYK